jgi:hypothetical protein
MTDAVQQPASSPATTMRVARVRYWTSVLKAIQGQTWSNPLVLAIAFGALMVVLYGWTRGAGNSQTIITVGLLASITAMAAGAMLGFLFGIPRAVQEPTRTGGRLDRYETQYLVNTNLEQISDWLTKIIVGLTLIELGQIGPRFVALADYVADAYGKGIVPSSLVSLDLLYFGICGFLTFYLWTRLFLTQEFSRTDRAARESPEFYEGLIQALTYQAAPNGFTQALAAASEFRERFGDGNWRVWRSIACSYGQMYRYTSLTTINLGLSLEEIRTKALEAVRAVLVLRPAEKQSLQALWDPVLASPEEDDLVVFFNDPEFKALLGDDPGGAAAAAPS